MSQLTSKLADLVWVLFKTGLLALILVGGVIGSVLGGVCALVTLYAAGFSFFSFLVGAVAATAGLNGTIWLARLVGMRLFPEAWALVLQRQAAANQEAMLKNMFANMIGADPNEIKDFQVRRVDASELADVVSEMTAAQDPNKKGNLN